MLKYIAFLLLFKSSLSQDLNLIPNILKPYFVSADQLVSINLMANISEKLFHAQKIGLTFGILTIVICVYLESIIAHFDFQNPQCYATTMTL